MPEGHVIHRLARGLRSTLGDAPIRASSPQGRFEASAALLDGERVTRTEAWGKYLFVSTTGGQILHVHLGLIGKFRSKDVPAPEPTPTVRLRLENDGGCWDLTGPTRCELLTPRERRAIIERLGPDPLRRSPRTEVLFERLSRTSIPIGATLLDQSIIAGLGNIYRAEVLFLCGIDPRRPSNRLSHEEVEEIWEQSVRLLRIGVTTGSIITTDPAEIGRTRGRMRPDDHLYVYHRDHCRRCGTELRTIDLAGRAITYCPVHQPT